VNFAPKCHLCGCGLDIHEARVEHNLVILGVTPCERCTDEKDQRVVDRVLRKAFNRFLSITVGVELDDKRRAVDQVMELVTKYSNALNEKAAADEAYEEGYAAGKELIERKIVKTVVGED
jgi:hypothetical protein